MKKLLWEEWPDNVTIDIPSNLFVCMEGMLHDDTEVGECLIKCLRLYGGLGREGSGNSYINLILDWLEEGLYDDDWTNIDKYAEKVRYMREGPDLKVGQIYKKDFS